VTSRSASRVTAGVHRIDCAHRPAVGGHDRPLRCVGAAIGELKAKPAGELQVHGSGTLTRWLLENDLVDEMNLLIVPVASVKARGSSPTPARTSRLTWSNLEPPRRA
jgi:riboflavin biosynthesis pyrimidine reductase